MAANKPIVGLNMDFRASRPERWPTSFSWINAGYADRIIAAGAIPVMLPPIPDDDDLLQILRHLDAVVMVGCGDDLDCRLDGYMLDHTMRVMDPRRELFDRRLLNLIREEGMPVLGIGAGMQLLNVQNGGTLFLDIHEDYPKAIPHRDLHGDPEHFHSLEFEEESLIGRAFGESQPMLISRHHQAVDDVAPGFRVTARCPDGIVEAIESTSDWFAAGVQFRPEDGPAMGVCVLREFVDSIPQLRLAAA